ncbi:MAG TPA: hypothetical protein VMF65_25815 [Acidimicrobiales bacterium]|nr:hypothetical protein [Acidimicrobiales bacterium]
MILNGAARFETVEAMVAHVDEFGGPTAYNHYAVGWAHAMDTPYQWTKQVASHWDDRSASRRIASDVHAFLS